MNDLKGKSLALFDFDKTITDRDTFFDFLFFACGKIKVILVIILLSPAILFYFLGIFKAKRLKEMFFKRLIKGWTVKNFDLKAKMYTQLRLKNIVRQSALDEIDEHRRNGTDIVIVSASPSSWIKFFAKEHQLDLIATELEIIDGCFSGKIVGENCRGIEKTRRIKKLYNVKKYQNVFAYGDSSGDKEMLEMANHKYFNVLK